MKKAKNDENDLSDLKPNSKQSKPHLADVINYDTDIAPHRLIKLYSGVGSGKNYFVDHLLIGDTFTHADNTPVGPKSALLLSPRRAKNDEIIASSKGRYDPSIGMLDYGAYSWAGKQDEELGLMAEEGPKVQLPDLNKLGPMEVPKRNVANTNAKIGAKLKWTYAPLDVSSHPWHRFDFIVVDEAHILISDATYQPAPFDVRALIDEALRQSSTCKIILMTGSPELLEENDMFSDAHVINLMDVCINVTPQAISFITRQEANELQQAMLREQMKFIAFYNHIDTLLSFYEQTPRHCRDGIAMSFSDSTQIKELNSRDSSLVEKMTAVQMHLAKHQRLPDEVVAFLSTSKNKEGININNEDFYAMFVESHAKLDIIQMAGRLREAPFKLYVITDSEPHPDFESPCEWQFTPSALPLVNHNYQQLCQEINYPWGKMDSMNHLPPYTIDELARYIKFIHNKYPYIRFNYFSDSFELHKERNLGRSYYKKQQAIFEKALRSKESLWALAQAWYPGLKCMFSNAIVFPDDMQHTVDAHLKEHGWLDWNTPIRQAEMKQLLNELNALLGTKSKQLKTLLRKYGYDLVAETKSKNSYTRHHILKHQVSSAA